MPERIQLSRRKGYRKPEGAVVVSRPSKWGNPFAVGRDKWLHNDRDESVVLVHPKDNAEAVAYFRWYVETSQIRREAISKLAGRDLACWCPLDQPCHADVLLEIANGPTNGENQ